jgi:hypothetical protein
MKKLLPLLVLATLAVVLAGCGGGGSKSSSGGGGATTSGGGGGGGSSSGRSGIDIGNCLNENYDFLVQPSESSVDGMSPAGVSFSMTLYPSPAAAKAAYQKKQPKTTALVDTGVVDFHGNPSPYQGAPPAKISKVELGNIKSCIEKGK